MLYFIKNFDLWIMEVRNGMFKGVSFCSYSGVNSCTPITQDDTQILMKANTYNKTGGLDIYMVRLSRPGRKYILVDIGSSYFTR
jgi:hypothetical protein